MTPRPIEWSLTGRIRWLVKKDGTSVLQQEWRMLNSYQVVQKNDVIEWREIPVVHEEGEGGDLNAPS